MNLIKTSFYTAISTAVAFISGFIVIKVIAVKIGPAGMAIAGQYQNTTSIFGFLATFALTVGVTKYLAEYHNDQAKKQKVITTSLTIILLCSVIISFFIILASNWLSKASLHTPEYRVVYILYGFFISLISLNTLMAAVFNGLKQIKTLTIVAVSSSVAGVIITLLMANAFGVKGVLIAGNFTALVAFILNIFFIKRIKDFDWSPSFKKWDKKILLMLLAFSLMNIISGTVSQFAQLLIRDKIIKDFSATDAGYWQAITKVSDYYLTFIITILSVYYLPRLSEISEKSELKNEILKGYKIILPVVGILAFLVWLLKDLIIQIIFTPSFLPMQPLFKYQLIGDFLKIGSWLLAFLMLSKALTKTFIFSEIIFSATYVFLCYMLINKFGIIGTTYAFCINYALYWVVMFFLMRKYIV